MKIQVKIFTIIRVVKDSLEQSNKNTIGHNRWDRAKVILKRKPLIFGAVIRKWGNKYVLLSRGRIARRKELQQKQELIKRKMSHFMFLCGNSGY